MKLDAFATATVPIFANPTYSENFSRKFFQNRNFDIIALALSLLLTLSYEIAFYPHIVNTANIPGKDITQEELKHYFINRLIQIEIELDQDVIHATGFIISHNGYAITAAHLFNGTTNKPNMHISKYQGNNRIELNYD